jgi:hypothetical protein
MEHNMIVPFKRALKTLENINLPVYGEFAGDFKCHFRDVVKRLTRFALELKNPGYDPTGVEYKHLKILTRAWTEKYPDLKTMKLRKGFDTGRVWASLFIASCLKNVMNLRKMKRQKLDKNNKQKNPSCAKSSKCKKDHSMIKSDNDNSSNPKKRLEKQYSLKLEAIKMTQEDPYISNNAVVNDKKLQEQFGLKENDIAIIKHCD